MVLCLNRCSQYLSKCQKEETASARNLSSPEVTAYARSADVSNVDYKKLTGRYTPLSLTTISINQPIFLEQLFSIRAFGAYHSFYTPLVPGSSCC